MNEQPIQYCHYIVESFKVKNIEGKLLTIVESIGLPETQEKAVKGLVRQAIWDVIDNVNVPIVYDGQEGHKLYLFLEELRKSRIGAMEAPEKSSKKSKS
jgi:hypothetical protein